MSTLNISIVGKLVDYGNLGWGRGIQLEVEGETISVTDLTEKEIEAVKPFLGKQVRLSISGADPTTAEGN